MGSGGDGPELPEERILTGLMVGIFSNNRNFISMNSGEIGILKYLAQNDNSTGSYAKTVLRIFTDEVVAEKPATTPPPVASQSFVSKDSEGQDLAIQLYPNPASSLITLKYQMEDKLVKANLEIFDVLGKRLLAVPLNAAGNTMQLDISSLPAGIYQVSVRTSSETMFQTKLMVVR